MSRPTDWHPEEEHLLAGMFRRGDAMEKLVRKFQRPEEEILAKWQELQDKREAATALLKTEVIAERNPAQVPIIEAARLTSEATGMLIETIDWLGHHLSGPEILDMLRTAFESGPPCMSLKERLTIYLNENYILIPKTIPHGETRPGNETESGQEGGGEDSREGS